MVAFAINDAFITVCNEIYKRLDSFSSLTDDELLKYLLQTTDNLNALKIHENIIKRDWEKVPEVLFREYEDYKDYG